MNTPLLRPDPLAGMVERELRPGESLCWTGQPDPIQAAVTRLPAAIGSLVCVVTALVLLASRPLPLPALNAGLAVVLVVIAAFLLSYPIRRFRRALRVRYAVTTQRALIVEGDKTPLVGSFESYTLLTIVKRYRRDGSADIVLGRQSPGIETAFVGIPDPGEAETLLLKLALSSAEGLVPPDNLAGYQMDDLKAELRPGERVLWTGEPAPWRLAWSSASIISPPHAWSPLRRMLWGLPWTLVALAAAAAALVTGWHVGIVVPSLFVLLVPGLWLTSAPLQMLGRAKKTVYALTNRRVIVMEQGPRPDVATFTPAALLDATAVSRRDGSGNIEGIACFGGRTRLVGIPDANRVASLIREMVGRAWEKTGA